MSYIELPAAEYRRRLAALPRHPPEDPIPPARIIVPLDAVTEDEVRAARARYPQAFAAIGSDLSATEIAARERLVTEAIRVGYRPPE